MMLGFMNIIAARDTHLEKASNNSIRIARMFIRKYYRKISMQMYTHTYIDLLIKGLYLFS